MINVGFAKHKQNNLYALGIHFLGISHHFPHRHLALGSSLFQLIPQQVVALVLGKTPFFLASSPPATS